jgi:hypothetical protein
VVLLGLQYMVRRPVAKAYVAQQATGKPHDGAYPYRLGQHHRRQSHNHRLWHAVSNSARGCAGRATMILAREGIAAVSAILRWLSFSYLA